MALAGSPWRGAAAQPRARRWEPAEQIDPARPAQRHHRGERHLGPLRADESSSLVLPLPIGLDGGIRPCPVRLTHRTPGIDISTAVELARATVGPGAHLGQDPVDGIENRVEFRPVLCVDDQPVVAIDGRLQRFAVENAYRRCGIEHTGIEPNERVLLDGNPWPLTSVGGWNPLVLGGGNVSIPGGWNFRHANLRGSVSGGGVQRCGSWRSRGLNWAGNGCVATGAPPV